MADEMIQSTKDDTPDRALQKTLRLYECELLTRCQQSVTYNQIYVLS
jgi:hypothetical protein